MRGGTRRFHTFFQPSDTNPMVGVLMLALDSFPPTFFLHCYELRHFGLLRSFSMAAMPSTTARRDSLAHSSLFSVYNSTCPNERLASEHPDKRPRPDTPRLLCFPLGPATTQSIGGTRHQCAKDRSTLVSGQSVQALISAAKWSSPATELSSAQKATPHGAG